MKPVARYILAACLGLAPAIALADTPPTELVATFITMCGKTHGDAAGALAVADHEGWTPPPARALQPPTFGSARWTQLDGRFSRSPAGLRSLEVGTQTDPSGHIAHSCTLTDWQPASVADMDGLRDALGRWVGGEPVKMNGPAFALFAFRELGGKRIPLLPNDPALSADMPPASVMEVTLVNALGKPIIMYLTWR